MSLRVGVWGLPYGLCVDVYHNEAWWEGAVFDQEDGSEERLIFIPNSGTEIKIGIDMLRITQDWDLTTGEVKPRGKWLFLELVEELEREQKQPLGVSMKEMWLGVSAKEMWLAVQDKVKDCTCSVKPLLCELVSETFKELVDSKGLFPERTVLDEDLENSQVVDLVNPNPDLANSQVALPTDNPLNDDVVIVDESNDKNLINPDAVGVTSIGAISSSGGGVSNADCNKIDEKPTKSRCRLSWQLAGPDIIGIAKYCPNAVIKYALNSTNSRDLAAVVDIRQHLSYLGWKIEYVSFNGHSNVFRFRYTSPHGKRYLSLVQICQDLKESTMEIPPPISQDESASTMEIPTPISQDESASQNDIIISSSSKETNVCPLVKGPSSRYTRYILVVEPEQCPEAVVFWYLNGLDTKQLKEEGIKASDMILKVKKHLSFLGWVIWYFYRGTKREMRYTSPSRANYNSLRTACKACIDGGQMPESLASSEKLCSSTANAKLQESFVPANASTSNAKLQESFVPPNANQSSRTPQSKKRKRKDDLSEDEYPSFHVTNRITKIEEILDD